MQWHPGRRDGAKVPKLLALALLSTLLLSWSVVKAPPTAFLSKKHHHKGKQQVLFRKFGYELVMSPGKGKVPLPGFQFRKIPLEPWTLSVGGQAESDASKSALTGFPFTTDNAATLLLGLPRIGGRVRIGLEDPALSSEGEDTSQQMEAGYEQRLPGGGRLAARMRSTGEWGASFLHEVEDIGEVRGGLNSQLDWNLDLNTTYPEVKGFTPSVTYGATQDGMRVHARVDKDFSKHWHASYDLQNIPGKYSPVDFVHDGAVRFTAGPHTLQATASYDRQLLKRPVQGSVSYALQTRHAALQASLDSQQYQLAMRAGPAKVAAVLSRANEEGERPASLELRVGQAAATILADGTNKPRIRLSKDLGA
mmetsp:Transcript_25293/g.57075  ORF Transcript_25293/g.57075 Transcript_25293/m.57075 type:complete len:365 (+) Transcript_25293:67-1161(+)